jgi:hypothetical protein
MPENKEKCCVCINVFTKCEKDHSWRKEEESFREKKQDCCVCINVFTECEKDDECYGDKKNDCCVCINAFTKCKKVHRVKEEYVAKDPTE